LKVDITKLNPPQQVEVLISTLEKKGDIIPFVNGLEHQYKTYQDFIDTRDYEAFKSRKLIELTLNALKRNDESTLPSFLALLKIIAQLGNPSFSPFSFFFSTDESVFLFFVDFFCLFQLTTKLQLHPKEALKWSSKQ
jgi:hypothetical protein